MRSPKDKKCSVLFWSRVTNFHLYACVAYRYEPEYRNMLAGVQTWRETHSRGRRGLTSQLSLHILNGLTRFHLAKSINLFPAGKSLKIIFLIFFTLNA